MASCTRITISVSKITKHDIRKIVIYRIATVFKLANFTTVNSTLKTGKYVGRSNSRIVSKVGCSK